MSEYEHWHREHVKTLGGGSNSKVSNMIDPEVLE